MDPSKQDSRRSAGRRGGLSQSLLVGLCAFAVGAEALEAQARADDRDFSAAEEGWQGLSEFTRLAAEELGRERLHVVAEIDFASLRPTDALVILHPEVELDGRSLTAFLAAGGRLALLDDFGRGSSFLQTFGIERVPSPPDARFSLRGDPDLAIASPYEETVAGARVGRHPMLEGIDRVVTNHPRTLEHPDLTPILGIERNDGSLAPILLTGVIAGRGRLVAGSDPSIFINLMLRYPGNRQLVHGLLGYLTAREPDSGAAPGRVLLATGRFTQVGSYGGEEDPLLAWRRKLSRLQNDLADAFARGIPDFVWLLGAALLGVFIVLGETARARLRGAFEQPRYARPVLVLAQAGPWARAEVLAAPGTTPLLSLVELETALSEALKERLGIAPAQTAAALRGDLTARGLDASSADRLVGLLAELRQFGQSLALRRPKRPSSAQLKRLHDLGMHLLAGIERLEHSSAARGVTPTSSAERPGRLPGKRV